jgi:inosose dehydratase
MTAFRYGICTHTWGPRPLAEILDEVAAAGYTGVECFDHHLAAFFDNPGIFSRMLSDRNLALASVYYEGGFMDPGDRERETEAASRAAAFCSALGCDMLAVGMGRHPEGSRLDYDCMCATLEAVGRTTQRHGVLACFHPHVGSAVETGAEIARVFHHTDPSLVKFCVDTGHIAKGGSDPVAVTRTYLDRVAHVHLKDRHPSGRFVELGRGDLANEAVLRMVEEAGYRGWVMSEVPLSDVTEKTPMESALACHSWLAQIK